MRNAVVGSTLVHLALLLGVFVYGRSAPRYLAGPDAIQVAVLDAGSLPVVPPMPKTEPPPPEEPAKLAPTDETGIKVDPPKPAAVKAKPDAPKPPPAPSTPALRFERVGAPGLAAAVGTDDADFAFSYYLTLVRNRVAENWTPPNGLPAGGAAVRAVVFFRIGRDGSVSAIRLESASGAEFFDRSALRAIVLSNPMPALPDGWSSPTLGVHFGFEYEAP